MYVFVGEASPGELFGVVSPPFVSLGWTDYNDEHGVFLLSLTSLMTSRILMLCLERKNE